MGKTLFDKVWDNHIVDNIPNGPSILYVDQHLIHEVTSPQAFSGLKKRNIDVFRKDKTVATADHWYPNKKESKDMLVFKILYFLEIIIKCILVMQRIAFNVYLQN